MDLCHRRWWLVKLSGSVCLGSGACFRRRVRCGGRYERDGPGWRQPILGICLGSQLIARALGAAVRRNPVKEIGWYDVRFTAGAGEDRLFRGLSTETVFHWHGETFDLPPGAELLASSDLCRHQAYRIGERVYAIQFHLEVTPEMIADWCVQDENSGDVRELERAIDPSFHVPRLAALSALVFGRWGEILGNPGVATCDTRVV